MTKPTGDKLSPEQELRDLNTPGLMKTRLYSFEEVKEIVKQAGIVSPTSAKNAQVQSWEERSKRMILILLQAAEYGKEGGGLTTDRVTELVNKLNQEINQAKLEALDEVETIIGEDEVGDSEIRIYFDKKEFNKALTKLKSSLKEE